MMRRFEGWVVDKFYGGTVVKDVVIACLEADMLEDIMSFLTRHAERFQNAQKNLTAGEHSLEGTQIHHEYIELIEERLSRPLEKHNKTVEQFMGYCQKIQDAGHAEEIAPFINLILAATDYILFSDIMSDEGKRSYFFVILRGLQNQFKRDLALQEEQLGGGRQVDNENKNDVGEGKSEGKSNSSRK